MQSLCVTDKQVSVRSQLPRELAENALLRRTVKIDDDVAAEDSIRFFGDAVVGVHEVESPELNETPQLRHDAHAAGVRVAAAHEIFDLQRRRHGAHHFVRVDAQRRFFKHGGRDVASQDAEGKAWMREGVFA